MRRLAGLGAAAWRCKSYEPTLLAEAAKLSVAERIELVEAIWDTIAVDPASLPLPIALAQEGRALHEALYKRRG